MAEKRDYNEENGELLMDAPAFRYIFIEEITKTKVTTDSTFEILLQVTYDDGAVESFLKRCRENRVSFLALNHLIAPIFVMNFPWKENRTPF